MKENIFMNCKIKVKINPCYPVWISPKVDNEVIKMLQDFDLVIEKTAAPKNSSRLTGPGDVPCVIIRNFSKIVAMNDFQSASMVYLDDENWSIKWIDGTDLCFSYTDGAPFEDGTDEYRFKWRNFYTLVSPGIEKKETVRIDAYAIPDCPEGNQSSVTVSFGYPAYINSFKPNESKSNGLIETDLKNGSCIVSKNGSVELQWICSADLTDTVELEENNRRLPDSFFINDSYNTGAIVSDMLYKLTVKNSYNFPDKRTFSIYKTDWEKKGEENGVFQGNIYGETEYNTKIFLYNGDYYFYSHPCLYKRGNEGWTVISENNLYSDSKYICRASYLQNGVLYAAGNVKGSRYFSFCRYDINSGKWEKEDGTLNYNSPLCCGYAFSGDKAYFYQVYAGFISANLKENESWSGGQVYYNAPDNMNIISGGMCFYVNQFYVAILCESKNESRGKYAYLYDFSEFSETYIMKIRVSDTARTTALIETDNALWLATESGLIDCTCKIYHSSFYPDVPDTNKAWFGSDGENVLGIFPDKNLWVYDYDRKNAKVSKCPDAGV